VKRILQIAATLFFGVLTVALVSLWVSSYWRFIVGRGQFPDDYAFSFQALDGSTTVHFIRFNLDWQWEMKSSDATSYPAMRQVRDPAALYTFR
jgi:hypothetical protein